MCECTFLINAWPIRVNSGKSSTRAAPVGDMANLEREKDEEVILCILKPYAGRSSTNTTPHSSRYNNLAVIVQAVEAQAQVAKVKRMTERV
jgi:hypothetical protein